MIERFYATLGVGVEQVVSRELQALGITVTRIEPGRARFETDLDGMYRALISLRCASRVVRELHFEEIASEQDVYEVVRTLDWKPWIPPGSTIRVQFNVHSSLLKSTRFGLYRIKDAICDQMVEQCGWRPSVDTEKPDLAVRCYLENRRFSVGLDAAGEPLHMRGYRVTQHETSLREHLAAAMVLQSGWDATKPLHDPFCGSATILTEAAMIATNTPPSHFRNEFGCMGWPDFDAKRFEELRSEAEARICKPDGLRISGADRSSKAIEQARANVAAAGYEGVITVEERDVAMLGGLENAWIITNPPYGVRTGDEAECVPVWRSFREGVLRCPGARVAVIAAEGGFEKAFGLKPFKRNRLNNGAIRCVLGQYEVRA